MLGVCLWDLTLQRGLSQVPSQSHLTNQFLVVGITPLAQTIHFRQMDMLASSAV